MEQQKGRLEDFGELANQSEAMNFTSSTHWWAIGKLLYSQIFRSQGKIVIVRYGSNFRGLKSWSLAQERGADGDFNLL